MNFLGVIIFAAAAWLASICFYKLKRPDDLPETRPAFVLFPKYQFDAELSEPLLQANDRVAEIISILKSDAFSEVARTSETVALTRGKWFGDFSTKWTKLDVALYLPVHHSVTLRLSYGAFAIFDTGDLWLYCHEIREKLAESA